MDTDVSAARASDRIDFATWEKVAAVVAAIAFVACTVFVSRIPPVPDHGYQFYLAQRMLNGARLYTDVAAAELHPPLVTWIDAAFILLGKLVGLEGFPLFMIVTCIAAGVSALSLARLAPRSTFLPAAVLFLLFPVADYFFAQGEHLAVILILPYLAAAARAGDDPPLSLVLRFALALAAGLGMAMKPHFALVWMGVELYLARRRGLRSLLRIEAITIGALFVLYVAATLLFTPQFFTALPTMMPLYARFGSEPRIDIILDPRSILFLAALACAALVRWRAPGTWHARAAVTFAIADCAMFVAVVAQGKGWGYHWYPVNALSGFIIALALQIFLQGWAVIPAAVLACAAAVMMSRVPEKTARVLIAGPSWLGDMIVVTERFAPTGSIVALSHNLSVGFPLVNVTRLGWASPYGHLWMVPAMYADTWRSGKPFQYRNSGKWRAVEQTMFDRLWDTIERTNPELIFVPLPLSNGFDMRAYFETDPRFRARFAASRPVAQVGYFIALARPK